ncbi:hypothetical protein BASA81_006549 [Batrachochytrium salamandrivorans]|nr:hypothetical protein BASA81_006549 [Batrachochytrium salamandrivorans]
MDTAEFDPAVLDQLDKWIRTKGGRVQSKLINEFYQKNQPINKITLLGKLHLLADCKAATVHLVGNAFNSAEYLELKYLGSKPYRPPVPAAVPAPPITVAAVVAAAPKPPAAAAAAVTAAATTSHYPQFIKQSGYQYAIAKTSNVVKAVLDQWQVTYSALAFDFKGDIRSEGRVALMQVSTIDHQVLMVDMGDNPRIMLDSGLRHYFENKSKIKVILDSARSAEALRTIWGIQIVNVFDLSRSFIVAKLGSLPDKLEQGASLVEMIKEFNLDFPRTPKPEESVGWFKRPLTLPQLEYAAKGVVLNCQIYELIRERAKQYGLDEVCFRESAIYSRSLHRGGNGNSAPTPALSAVQARLQEPNWTCLRCNYVNFARRAACKSCESSKPKQRSSHHSSSTTNRSSVQANKANGGLPPGIALQTARERQIEKLFDMGLTMDHCYYYHVEGKCMGGLASGPSGEAKDCHFVHDKEFKELQLRESERKKQTQQTDEQRMQEMEDLALERAMKESLRSEEERLERQRKLQAEQMIQFQQQREAEAKAKAQVKTKAQDQKTQTKLLQTTKPVVEVSFVPKTKSPLLPMQSPSQFVPQQQYAYVPSSYQPLVKPPAVLYTPVLPSSTHKDQLQPFQPFQQQHASGYSFDLLQAVNNSKPMVVDSKPQQLNETHMLLSMEIGVIVDEVKINPQWQQLLMSCALATGAVTEMREVNLVKFAKALAEGGMPLPDQSKFIKEVYKRRTVKN